MSYDYFSNTKRIDIEDYFNNLNTNYYDEIDLEDFEYNKETKIFSYPCPCGDEFQITLEDLLDEEIIARCLSCTLIIKVIYETNQLKKYS